MLALDEFRKMDEIFKIGEFQFVVDKNLYHRIKPIKVDASPFGFEIKAAVNYGASYFSSSYNGSGCR